MKRKYIYIGLGAALIYVALLGLLILAESGSPDASITGPGVAVWYSLTTLTTVGYGDAYPVTTFGRIIGGIFQLMSIGVLVALISAVLSLIRGRLLPLMILRFQRKRHWYIFAGINERSVRIAEALSNQKDENEKKSIIFSDDGHEDSIIPVGVKVALPPEKLLEYQKQKGPASIFAVGDDQAENDRLAYDFKDLPCKVYAMTSYEPDRLSDKLVLFNPHEICARLYWNRYPVSSKSESIVMVGSGRDAEAILEQAVMFNVLAPDQHLTYHVFGDFTDFRYFHPCLGQIFRDCLGVGTKAAADKETADMSLAQDGFCAAKDRLIFHDEPWNADLDILINADRIIFCGDSVEESLDQVTFLKRACPLKGVVYVRGAAPLEGIITFGTLDDLCTLELTMRTKLNENAMHLHKLYQEQAPGAACWEELSGFLRRSNIASADHLLMKARILLGGEGPLSPDLIPDAAAVYEKADEETKDICRRIEHERWMRFHFMNNWHYAPVRNNPARQHPLLLPYDSLSLEDQLKDDYGWQLLGQLAH